MYQNYAWFAQKSGPPNESWRLINSLCDVQGLCAQAQVDEVDPLYFEWGVTGGHHRSMPITTKNLKSVMFAIDMWFSSPLTGPVYVYGRRNMFEPLLHHWRREKSRVDRPQMIDILESLILPEAVPTLRDRNSVDRCFAAWLTDGVALQPLDFFNLIQPPEPPTA